MFWLFGSFLSVFAAVLAVVGDVLIVFVNVLAVFVCFLHVFFSFSIIQEETFISIYQSSFSLYQLTFSARFGNRASSASFLSRIIKPLINATLSLPHPTSQAPFLSVIMLHLICL